MKFRYSAVVLVALALLSGTAFAQPETPIEEQLPWFDYRPERIENNFESIIGLPGTTRINGSQAQGWTSSTQYEDDMSLPFPFTFLRVRYNSGTRIVAGHSGWISFNQSGNPWGWGHWQPQLTYYGTNNASGAYNKVIAPFWSDLQTTGLANPGGGIYWRIDDDDNVAGKQIMTIEWRAQGGRYPAGNPGNFQVQLYEENSVIEFHYGENPIRRTTPARGNVLGYGAIVGLKNLGQDRAITALTRESYNNDEDNFMLLVHPDQVIEGRPTGEDTMAITREVTGNKRWGGAGSPAVFAYDYGNFYNPVINYIATSSFHYNFPTEFQDPIAYRVRPILNDVACDSVWFLPDDQDGVDAFNKNQPVIVNARFQNRAGNEKNNIPVMFDVYYNSETLVYSSQQETTSPGSRLGTDDVRFRPIPGNNHVLTGLYQVRVYPQDPLEEDFKNDTCKVPYFIKGRKDIMAFKILSPFKNEPPLFTKYPVGVGVPIEVRYLNVGSQEPSNVPVGYEIYDQDGNLVNRTTGLIPGTFKSITFRDINLPTWTPDVPGTYFLRVLTNLADDELRLNDTLPRTNKLGYAFSANYTIELAAGDNGISPFQTERYPVGQSIPVIATFSNNGITDATNTPARVTITDPNGNVVYDQTETVLEVISGGIPANQIFPDFVPSPASGPGRYCVTATITNPDDPIATNNTITWCFTVLSQLRGDILVGFGERFQTIEEARDSLFYLGVSGPVNLLLIDDEFVVNASNNDASLPALDMRGEIVGAGENSPITWRPHPNKTEVVVRLQSPSGLGIWFGQQDTMNPNGYMIFDGGADKRLRFVLEQTRTDRDLAVPFMFGRGASNYTVKNVVIEAPDPLACTKAITLPTYDAGFNRFTYRSDLDQNVSAGIMLRNTMPFDPVTLTNGNNADTLFNQNNVFEGNEIRGFAYGILSVGAGPIFRGQTARFEAINNRNNVYRENVITNVGRGGIVVANESSSVIERNWITGVNNNCGPATKEKGSSVQSTPGDHAAGIWVTAGGNASNNRGFSNDLEIVGNRVSDIRTDAGVAAGIWVENNRNVLVTPANVVQEFPGQSDMDVRNNMAWDYAGDAMSIGIGFTVGAESGSDYTPSGNMSYNNTIYNASSGSSSTTEEYGIAVMNSEASVKNNLVALTNPSAVGLGYIARSMQNDLRSLSIESDYNLIWAPSGSVGGLQRTSAEGFGLPSPPIADNLSQWQYLTGLDMNSVVGNVVPEFKSTTPGSEDLHLNPQLKRSIAGNRGTQLAEVTTDIDSEPRGQAATQGRYDIGADEFWGVVHNHDIVADNVIGPFGYRESTGTFSDAEYVMTGPEVPLTAQVRNLGGSPLASTTVTMDVEYWNGSTWINTMSATRESSLVDVSEATEVDFGTFEPQTMLELTMDDATFGTMRPNVTPIYRFVVQTGNDGDLTNNRYEKRVRFYVERSKTEAIVSVENFAPVGSVLPTDQVELGNRLNGDSLLSALTQIRWDRTGVTGGNAAYNYDVFERDRWPQYALNFAPWQFVMWAQGEEVGGLTPEERVAMKDQQQAWNEWRPAGLFLMGQEIARVHDVALNQFNGDEADRDFVRNYLRAEYRGSTDPAVYDNLRLQGVRITNGRFEMVNATGVAGDADPEPSVLRATTGDGVAQGTHYFVDHNFASTAGDSLAGMTVANRTRASVYYAIDIRHFGRFAPEADRSGVRRAVLGAIDFLDQYGVVLPVDLASLEAEQTGREAVTIRWETASEKEIAGLELERAEVLKTEAGEQLSGYQLISERAPEGGPAQAAKYQELDQSVRAGREYEYRLVSIEKDGSRQELRTVRVQLTGGNAGAYALEVRPNPVVHTGEISWRAPRGEEVSLVITNSLGEEVQSSVLVSEGEGVVEIDARELTSGQYLVRLTTRSGEVLTSTLQVRK